ncbi:ABC transporter substrate-binding protein [Bradyrhizobium sp. 141]|uniref:ABC transporter substrate-binding protein n=1 Tax=Bradyrhizobium sp. 141 TaxID=2782617 RepID=UPI001FFB2504|nr:ABC transporter substrate-binding protein [Bradyrhizobium sp. 141]MCK1718813.1 ABC transporter substrate-binding protein [Bradyrhizobium sp. 141]
MFRISRRKRLAITLSTLLSVLACSPPLSLAAFAAGKTITAVMHSDLRILDPIFTPAYITRDHGYMVYDTLLATDANFDVQPQMADWKISDDRLTYTFTLRDGLNWHDGTPVTAEDCVASLKRWSKSDGMGQRLMDSAASLEATDAKTITLKLREPYGLVLQSIAKQSTLVPFMMPKRLAETPPDKQISEQIGSGPFKFVQTEFRPGVKVAYEKNAAYVPRKEPPSGTSGGKIVKVDRVEWITMPDAQTAIYALQSNEIDFVESAPVDLLPSLQKNNDIEIRTLNKDGFQTYGRMNFLLPPFDKVEIRRAALLAINQKDVLDALVGDPKNYKICGAIFICDTPLASDVGSASLVKGDGISEAKSRLAATGYDGTPVVILAPNEWMLKPQPTVVAQLLRKAGFNVDLQATDWQTVVSRRNSQKPVNEGGWNMFFTTTAASDMMNPLVNNAVNTRGKIGGWFGWPEDAKIEQLRDAYARSSLPSEQKKIAEEIQKEVYDQVIYIPLGQYVRPSAWRKSLSGVLDGPATPLFWNVDKSK